METKHIKLKSLLNQLAALDEALCMIQNHIYNIDTKDLDSLLSTLNHAIAIAEFMLPFEPQTRGENDE